MNIQPYYVPPKEGELCLVKQIRDLLVKFGLEQKAKLYYDNSEKIKMALGKNQNVQRYHIHEWIFDQLLYCEKDTSRVRLSLPMNGEIHVWVEIVKKGVMPFFLENSLPNRV
jgi:hypothetical protein